MSSISKRKADHIQLCIDGDVAFRQKSNLFDNVELIHNALPELALFDIDLRCSFAEHELQAPLIIAAMTGGVERAEKINKDLATIAEEFGIGFAFGSQRPLLEKGITEGYYVRDVAPNTLLLGNIGIVQATKSSTAQLEELITFSGTNALCVHLNPAMEVVQPEGDQDFRKGCETISRLINELSVPIVIKETGCGLSRHTGKKLVDLGVKWVDVSGAGGTSWVGVEVHRTKEEHRGIGETFWDWGIPTAASVASLSDLNLGICATGGVSNGLMIAKGLSLGASCGGIARSFLQAHAEGGYEKARRRVKQVIDEIRIAMLLTGSENIQKLKESQFILGDKLKHWIPENSSLRNRILK
jgi:isopentenyl-diphosphate Delta-isomerase